MGSYWASGEPKVVFTVRTGLPHTVAWKEQKREWIVPLQARAALLLELSQRTSPVFPLPKQKGWTCCSLKGCRNLLLAQAMTGDKTTWKLLSKQLRGKPVTCGFLHKYAAETPLKEMTVGVHISCRVLPVSAGISRQHPQVMDCWLFRRLQFHCVTDSTQNNHRHNSFNVLLNTDNLPLNTLHLVKI